MTFAAMAMALLFAPPLHAQEEEGEVCPPGITVDLPIREIIVQGGATRTVLDMTVCNGTAEVQQVDIEFLGVPEGWVVGVREPFETFRITSLRLAAGAAKELELRPDAPSETESGTYSFTMRLSTPSGGTIEDVEIGVDVEAQEVVEYGGVLLQVTFPVLRGPSTSRFDFVVGVRNETGADGLFDLNATVPSGWDVFFTPATGAFQETTIFSTLGVRAGSTERMAVKVVPDPDTLPGLYPVRFVVGDQDAQDEITLTAAVTGIFEVAMTPGTGRLSIDATAGDREAIDIVLENLGTGILRQLALTSDTPEGWEVTFNPQGVDRLDPTDDPRVTVEVSITPTKDAIPGDYVVTLRTSSFEAGDVMDIRVTVGQSTTWGWLGVLILLIVFGSVAGLFWKLGRR